MTGHIQDLPSKHWKREHRLCDCPTIQACTTNSFKINLHDLHAYDTYHIHASIVFVEMQTTSSLVQGCESATKPIPGIMITSPHTCLHLELFPNFPHKITTNLRMYIDVTLVRIAQLTLGHIVMQRFS